MKEKKELKKLVNIVRVTKHQEQNQPIKSNKSIAVFDGFFDFLAYQTTH